MPTSQHFTVKSRGGESSTDRRRNGHARRSAGVPCWRRSDFRVAKRMRVGHAREAVSPALSVDPVECYRGLVECGQDLKLTSRDRVSSQFAVCRSSCLPKAGSTAVLAAWIPLCEFCLRAHNTHPAPAQSSRPSRLDWPANTADQVGLDWPTPRTPNATHAPLPPPKVQR